MINIKMSTTNGTGGNTPGGSRSIKKRSEPPVLGETRELVDNIFKFNSKDQADAYLRTREKTGEFVGRKYGRYMRTLVLYGKEQVFAEPKPPSKKEIEDSPALLEKYKVDRSHYKKEKETYEKDKSEVFYILLGQCSVNVKSKLKSDKEWSDLEQNYDVVALLDKLKEMAFPN